MRMRPALAGLGLLVLAASCAPLPPVPLDATPADLEVLAGEWDGTYESAALGRRGTITFKLTGGRDGAYGDVIMFPVTAWPLQETHVYQEGQYTGGTPRSEALTINFIRASDGAVTGALDRYWDPDRNCFATTTFTGRVTRGVVEGTFRTTFDGGSRQATGTWIARKKAAKPNAKWR
jgi:hypothetical protein